MLSKWNTIFIGVLILPYRTFMIIMIIISYYFEFINLFPSALFLFEARHCHVYERLHGNG